MRGIDPRKLDQGRLRQFARLAGAGVIWRRLEKQAHDAGIAARAGRLAVESFTRAAMALALAMDPRLRKARPFRRRRRWRMAGK